MRSLFILVQTKPDGDPEVNLKKARERIREAMDLYHPNAIVFPELYMSYFPTTGLVPGETWRTSQTQEGPFVTEMKKQARQHGVWLFFGMNERMGNPADHRVYNTVVVINANGEIAAIYRKTHLFNQINSRESDCIRPGDRLFEPIDTPFGRIGIFVCFEVRFPEIALWQCIRGAEILIMPTAWINGKLKSHQFHTLVTARAIETETYILACNHCGRISCGQSLAVDPRGVTIAAAGDDEELLPVYLDTKKVETARQRMPIIQSRRPELY